MKGSAMFGSPYTENSRLYSVLEICIPYTWSDSEGTQRACLSWTARGMGFS